MERSQRSLSFLALGDSYTVGEGVEPAERWLAQIVESPEVAAQASFEVDYVATTGWTTDELATGIRDARPRGRYDLVSLQIGVNNQYRGLPLDEYRRQFRALLAQAVAFAGHHHRRVLVLSIPDWSVTPFAVDRDRAQIAAEVDCFNTVNRAEALAAGVSYVDVTAVSRAYPNEVAADGLHPSAMMHRRWAAIALPAVLNALRDHRDNRA